MIIAILLFLILVALAPRACGVAVLVVIAFIIYANYEDAKRHENPRGHERLAWQEPDVSAGPVSGAGANQRIGSTVCVRRRNGQVCERVGGRP